MILGNALSCDIAFKGAACIQDRSINHRTRFAVHVPRAGFHQKCFCIWSLDLNLTKRRDIKDCRLGMRSCDFAFHIFKPIRAVKCQCRFCGFSEVEWAFPSIILTKMRARIDINVMQGQGAQIARGAQLFARIGDVIMRSQNFRGTCH